MALAKKFPNDIIESRYFYIFVDFYEHSVKKSVSSIIHNFGQLFGKWTQSALDTIPSQFNHIPRKLMPQKSKRMFPTTCCLILQKNILQENWH